MPEDAAVLRTQVASLRAANAGLRALLEDKEAKIAALEAQAAAQAERIARLERVVLLVKGDRSCLPDVTAALFRQFPCSRVVCPVADKSALSH